MSSPSSLTWWMHSGTAFWYAQLAITIKIGLTETPITTVMRPASVRTKILFLDMIATLGGDGRLDSVATAVPPGLPPRRDRAAQGQLIAEQPADHRSISDDTPSACGSRLVANGQVLTGLAGCTAPVPSHPQTHMRAGVAVSDDQPVLNTIAEITAVSLARGTLNAREHMLARLAALVAVDAPTVSYVLNFEPAAEVGLTVEDTQGLLVAVAPSWYGAGGVSGREKPSDSSAS